MRKDNTRLVLYGLALTVLVAGAATPIAAQEGKSPSATLNGATIKVDADETTTVSATYEFKVSSVGSGDKKLSSISGTLWTFSDHQVSDVSATVNGKEVSADVSRHARYVDVVVPVSDVSAGDTVSVTLTYTVTSAAGQLKAPIWVPEFQTAGQARDIQMQVTLPDGAQVHGAAFPQIDSKNGNVLNYDMLHVPGLVATTYGQGAGPLLSLDLLSTLAGLVMIFGFFGVWGAWQRGLIGSGGDSRVA